MWIDNQSQIPFQIWKKPLLFCLRQFSSEETEEWGIRLLDSDAVGSFAGRAYSERGSFDEGVECEDVPLRVKWFCWIELPKWTKRWTEYETATSTDFSLHSYYRQYKTLQRKFPNGFPFESWVDVFVTYVSHELFHLFEFSREYARISEVRADLFGLAVLDDWRVKTGRKRIDKT